MIKAWIEPGLDVVPAEVDTAEFELLMQEFAAATRETLKTAKEITGWSNAKVEKAIRSAFRAGVFVGGFYLEGDTEE